MKRRKKNRKLEAFLLGGVIVFVLILVSICLILGVLKRKENASRETELSGYSVEQQIKDEEAFVIETKYCNLYYPMKWKDNIRVEIVEEEDYLVQFYGKAGDREEQHIFEIVFGETDGLLLGNLKVEDKEIDLYLCTKEFNFTEEWTDDEINLVCAMQEDMNYLIVMLEKEDGYTSER